MRRSESFTQFTSPVGYTYRGVRHQTWSPYLYTVRRVSSLPEIHNRSCKPTQYPPWRKNLSQWGEWDNYWMDRRFHQMPRFTSHYTWPYRRQACLDAPTSYWWNYPSTYHYPKMYIRHDYFDDYYWRRFQEMRHSAPIYAPAGKNYWRTYVPPNSYLSYQHYQSRYY